MRQYYLLLIPLFFLSCERGWEPPENPDPQQILHEAQGDFKEQRYKDALAKHIWFHDHALEYQPSMYGVRLSFALSYWKQLSRKWLRSETTKLIGLDTEKEIDSYFMTSWLSIEPWNKTV